VALKHTWILAVFAALSVNCGQSTTPEPEAEEPEAVSVTRWTDQTELFAEYPPLVVGETSRFAIHLTRLDGFRALTEGHVSVTLRGGSARVETFQVDAPSRPGIFGVDVTPTQAGRRELVIMLASGGLKDEHQVGQVEVHRDAAAAQAAIATEAEVAPGISFLKEQQWTLDFGTAVVHVDAVRESIAVPARIEARPDGAADVVAPIDGRLTQVSPLAVGASISRDQELARLLPPTAAPSNFPELQRARAEAETALTLATRDRERAERLTKAGAAPERRLEEARAAEEQARVRLTAAETSLTQFNVVRAGGEASPAGLFILRAPLSGVVAVRNAVAGANVSAGTQLFRIVNAAQVHVVGLVSETDAARANAATGAELEIPGRSERVALGARVSIGKVLDPGSRTLPVTFALDNSQLGLPVGQTAMLHLLLAATTPRPVVPAAALVDDAGRPIVFVQLEGETFERRAVTVGARSGDVVQLIDGVKPGERVVTKGAYLVRLASLSTTVPAHGHVH
jgi:RND family efflux transporter MFP subunit